MRNALIAVVFAIFGLCANVARSDDGVRTDLAEAVTALAEWTPAVATKATWKSEYVTGNGYANGSALQEDLFLAWSSGLYLDFWHSGGSYRRSSASFADEVDYTVGLTGKVKVLGGEVDFDLAVSYFDLYRLGDGHGDMLDPALVLTKSFDLGAGSSLALSMKVEDAIALPSWDNRWIFTGGAAYGVDLGWQGASLSNTMKVVYDNGTSGTPSGNVLRWRVGLDVPLCEDKSMTLGVAYERFWIGSSIQDRKDVGSFEMSLAVKF